MSDSKPADTERQIENMKAVVDVAKAMARFIKVDDLLIFIVGETTKVMDADRSSLFLFDEKTNELWSKIAQGVDLMEIRFPVGAGIAGDVAATRAGSNIPDASDDPRELSRARGLTQHERGQMEQNEATNKSIPTFSYD